jgi:hypothetical protein
MQLKFYSTLECARLVGVAEHRLVYAHRAGKLAEPAYFVARKRLYTEEDVRRVAAYFENKKPRRNDDK